MTSAVLVARAVAMCSNATSSPKSPSSRPGVFNQHCGRNVPRIRQHQDIRPLAERPKACGFVLLRVFHMVRYHPF